MNLYTSAECWAMTVSWYHAAVLAIELAVTAMVWDLWRRRNRPRN